MYKIIIALGFFITSLVNGQDSIVVKIKSNDYKPINGVLTINQKNKTFDYSNKKGETTIIYKNKSEIINFDLSGYENLNLSVENILKQKKTIILKRKFETLDEIIVKVKKIPEYDSSFKFKSKKKYYTDIIGSNATFLSYYKNKTCKKCYLSTLVLFIKSDSTINLTDYRLKPLIFRKAKDSLINLFENPDMLNISENDKEILIDFSRLSLKFNKNEEFYIGFKLISNDKYSNKLKVRALNFKKSHSLLKKSPVDDWFVLDNDRNGYTLDFELYFRDTL